MGEKTENIPPEGGLAGWLSIIGCSCGLFSTFGFLNAVGVFQTFYQANILSEYTPSTISWIFALQLCLMWLPGPLFGRIIDTYGPRPVLLPSSVLCVFSLCMTSLSTKYYQIILAQGLGFGIGACGIFTASFVCAGQWFVRRRGLALGIVTGGSSLAGGVIFPLFVNKVTEDIGFYGAVRYTALLIGILLAISCCLITARLPPKPWNSKGKWIDFTLLKDKGFALYTIGAFLVMWGLWAPFDYLPNMAQATSSFSGSMSIYLISIINAGSIPGRVIMAALADKYGYFNMMSAISLSSAVSIFALWIPFDYYVSHAALIVFAAVYGYTSGGFISLLMPCTAKSGSLKTLGTRFGTFQLVMAFSCLTGLPIEGAILAEEGSFLGLQLFSACCILAGTCMIAGARVAL
ncbi:major facilitator superfamily domain-containing protein, partial [Hyaloscypha finlandica]